MSAVLRASGRDFDVDAFVAGCGWDVAKVFHRGEPVATRRDGRKSVRSGLNVVVSEAGFHDLAGQSRDAVEFLTVHAPEVRRLVEYRGVENVVLDFGIALRDTYTQFEEFSAELVRAAGACGIALAVSHYPVRGGSADASTSTEDAN